MIQYQCHRTQKMKGLDPNTYVYKYIRLEYLLSKDQKLRVDKVSTWEDPYENFFMKEDFYTYVSFYKKNVPVSTEEISKRLYGQSWTLKEESDAMWRIYSSKEGRIKEKAVKVRVKVDSLFSLVYTEDHCMATTSIGKVQYKTANEIEKWRNSLEYSSSDLPKLSEECLFMKRDSFEHEEEVRIIISEATNKPAQDFLEFDIPNIEIFEEFILDPRLNQEDINEAIQLISDCGVEQGLIQRSILYDFVPKSIKL